LRLHDLMQHYCVLKFNSPVFEYPVTAAFFPTREPCTRVHIPMHGTLRPSTELGIGRGTLH
ncbi:hypothetical protein, partial [Eggerthella lenta]|uniref:hypothetical protein n=1 Tax=Eggerthella lenta TaxID=84112 RepID=UPI001EE1F3F3